MKSDETIISEWQEMDSIDKILSALRHHELDMQEYLADTVAALCNVRKETMLGGSEKAYIAQARWLFWYAYRYMTGETLEKIANMTLLNGGHKFTTCGIGQSINKMTILISSDPLWEKRWNIIKRIIKLRDAKQEEPQDTTIVVRVPKGLKEKIKFEIKEK